MLTQRFLQDISTGVQTLRFLTALVVSAGVTSAVAGPMAYQAMTFEAPTAAAAASSPDAPEEERTPQTAANEPSVSATPLSRPQAGFPVAESSTSATSTTLQGPATTSLQVSATESTVTTERSAVPPSTDPPPTVRSAATTAPTGAPATSAPTATSSTSTSSGIGRFGPVACGDAVYEQDDERPGSCVNSTVPQ